MKEIKLISWNVNGIRAVEKKGFVEELLKWDADVICLQETKASPEQLSDAQEARGHHGQADSRCAGVQALIIAPRYAPPQVRSEAAIR